MHKEGRESSTTQGEGWTSVPLQAAPPKRREERKHHHPKRKEGPPLLPNFYFYFYYFHYYVHFHFHFHFHLNVYFYFLLPRFFLLYFHFDFWFLTFTFTLLFTFLLFTCHALPTVFWWICVKYFFWKHPGQEWKIEKKTSDGNAWGLSASRSTYLPPPPSFILGQVLHSFFLLWGGGVSPSSVAVALLGGAACGLRSKGVNFFFEYTFVIPTSACQIPETWGDGEEEASPKGGWGKAPPPKRREGPTKREKESNTTPTEGERSLPCVVLPSPPPSRWCCFLHSVRLCGAVILPPLLPPPPLPFHMWAGAACLHPSVGCCFHPWTVLPFPSSVWLVLLPLLFHSGWCWFPPSLFWVASVLLSGHASVGSKMYMLCKSKIQWVG